MHPATAGEMTVNIATVVAVHPVGAVAGKGITACRSKSSLVGWSGKRERVIMNEQRKGRQQHHQESSNLQKHPRLCSRAHPRIVHGINAGANSWEKLQETQELMHQSDVLSPGNDRVSQQMHLVYHCLKFSKARIVVGTYPTALLTGQN